MAITQSLYHLRIPLLLFVFLLIGCESKGVFIEGTLAVGTPALTTTTGDDNDTSLYNHVFVPDPSLSQTTNVSFTIGLNKVVLLSSTDSSLSYIVFDTGVNTPSTITLPYTANTKFLFGNSSNKPSNGTYDQVQYQVTFYEMTVPSQVKGDHRVRLNLAGYTLNNQAACQNDILLDLQFLDQSNGQPLANPRTACPTPAYQLPSTQFNSEFPSPPPPTLTDPYVFTLDLPPPGITISDSSDKVTIKLEFGIDNIFFFDDTEPPNGNGFFDPFSSCPTTSCDGRLSSAGTTSGNNSGFSADFWLGFPTVTATVE